MNKPLAAFALVLSCVALPVFATPPSNDDCAGAIVIPNGPYPVTTPPIEGVDATPQGSDDAGLFPAACNASGTDYTVWFTFTPSITTSYRFTTCAAAGATGNTVLDTVIAIFSSSDATCAGTMTSLGCNDSAACISPGDPSTFDVELTGGQTYFVVAGHWIPDGTIAPPNSSYVLRIDRSNGPANDTCAGAIPIPLGKLVRGTTQGAADDFQTPPACYTGQLGTQNPSSAPGRDVVFTFTAPAAGTYSIRQVTTSPNAALRGQNPVVYASSSCPAEGGTVVDCIAAANRVTTDGTQTATGINSNQSEELSCLPLAAGQTIYVFFDDGGSDNSGGDFAIEATPCHQEAEPNDTPATATAFGVCGENEGAATAAPTAHCVLGANNGQACRSTAAGCSAPGLCFADSLCEAGPRAGLACRPTCVGGTVPGNACTASSQCGTGGTCQTNGGCGVCTSGPNTGKACVSDTNCGTGGVCAAGVCGRTTNEGDVDFWTLGTPVAGSKVYAAVDAPASNEMDWRMRVTSTTETLGFDDDDGTSRQGTLAPTVAGAKTTGTETFVKVSRTSAFVAEPYRLYAVVEPPIAAAQPESGGEAWNIAYGWPGDGLFDDYLSNGANTGYITGTFVNAADSDCYKALAYEGDDLIWFGDSNPTRANGAGINSNPQIVIYDAAGAGISNFVFPTGTSRNIGPFTGNAGLNATTPQSTSFFQHWRATYSGLFNLCFYGFSTTSNTNGSLSYAGSLTANCGPMHPAGPGTTTADVSVTETGEAGPIESSGVTSFTITLTNASGDIAQEAVLDDTLDANLRYLSLTIDDGFGGKNTGCLSLPTPGQSDAPIRCTTMSLAPGASVTYVLTVQVADCLDTGVTISNTASVSTTSTDPNPANDAATWSFDIVHSDYCTAMFCDANGCIVDHCREPGTCNAGFCEAASVNGDDNNVCTADSCDPAVGIINDPINCDDFNVCTDNACDPVVGCIFPPAPEGTLCDDFNSCTANSTCDGSGNCVGHVPPSCDDGNPCTDDTVFGPNCVCHHLFSPDGTSCDDGNACTVGNTCSSGACGTPVAPAEAQSLSVSDDKISFAWSATPNATSYDVVRGLVSGLPAGPGGGEEVCFGGLTNPTVVDGTLPGAGASFWYLVRGAASGCPGTYGQRSDGTPRVTTTCP